MMRSHARSPRGKRASDHQPKARGTNYTVIGALGVNGMVATHLLDGSMRKLEFLRYLDECLLPKLKDSGHTLVMDNLRIHHAPEVKVLAEKYAVRLLFVPPYTPELNPIEHAWSKLKSFLRKCRARISDTLVDSVRNGLSRITHHDARGWIQHAGYRLSMGST